MLFSTLPLGEDTLKNLDALGYHEMTPIQEKSLPAILNKRDVLAKAQTGSGKTAAFGLGLLAKIDPYELDPQAMVLCPTRELADQVSKEIRRLARLTPNIKVLTLCGGKPFGMQAESLRVGGAHIVVGTPGRIMDHIERRTLPLDVINTLVLDEADRMLDMGFYEIIMDIIRTLPEPRQTLLFSATYPDEIAAISQSIQTDPIDISVDSIEDAPLITQMAYQVDQEDKNHALMAILAQHTEKSAIVFCRTKVSCDDVAIMLCQKGFHALAIHGDFEQRDREQMLLQFANLSCSILVATDVAARGLDIKDLPMVINYDLPSDADSYVHRIGRTGRAGKAGLAISLFNSKERFRLEGIEEFTGTKITIETQVPSYKNKGAIALPPMRTLCINAGKKNKMRPGDILGALTGEGGLTGQDVGKIDIFDFHAYVAIARNHSSHIIEKLQGKIKGRTFRMRFLDNLTY